MNNAILSKVAWRMGRRDEALWARTLWAKYLKGKSFFEYEMQKGNSPVWQGIVIKKGACFSIGNGCDINLWTDPWIPNLPGAVPIIKKGISCDHIK